MAQPTFSDHMTRQTAGLPDHAQSRTGQANSAQLKTASVAPSSTGQNEDTPTTPSDTAATNDTSQPLPSIKTAQEGASAKAKAVTADATAIIATSLSPFSAATKNNSSASIGGNTTTDSQHKASDSRSTKNQHTEKQTGSENTAGTSSSSAVSPSDTTLELAALSAIQPLSSPTEATTTISGNDDQTASSPVSALESIAPSSLSSGVSSQKTPQTAETVSSELSGTTGSLPGSGTSEDTSGPAPFHSLIDSELSDRISPIQSTSISDASSQSAESKITLSQTAGIKTADTQTANIQTTNSKTADTQTPSIQTTDSKTADTQTPSIQTTDSKTTDAHTASVQATSSKTADAQTASVKVTDSKTSLTMPADIKVSSGLNTNSASLSHDDVRPMNATSFSQIQSLQDIAATPVNAAGNRQSLSNNTQPSAKGQTDATSAPVTAHAQNAPIQPPVLSTLTQSSPTETVSVTQDSKIADTDTGQTSQVTSQSTDAPAQVQMTWNPAPVTSTAPTVKASASSASRLDDRTLSRTDISSSTQPQTIAAKPQTDEVSSPAVSAKTLSDQQGRGDDNKGSDQHTSSDQSLAANMTLPQAYNEAAPFSEQLFASTTNDTSSSAATTQQTSETTSSASSSITASADTSPTALNLAVALQNDDQTPLHVTIDKSDKSDGLNIHIGADGLTTLNELQSHKHELVHALENAGISTAGSQISFGLTDNSADLSFSQNSQSQQQPQDNSTNTTAGSSDFANAFGGTLSGNSNGDGSRNAWSATPSTTMTSAAASDADETGDQIYALTALRTGSVNITA
ncbi:hypothetical protein [Acetobacter sicerae]|uniref:hypothetical protein n=1 Tax=Acetobacter sicerae TaxID=85325 RepID=UPI001A7EB9F5|nr:hypothetical protein [Acetobacter sicerae]